MVNRGSTASGMKMDRMDTKAMLKAITFGMDRVFGEAKEGESQYLNDKEIDRIIDRSITQESLDKIQSEKKNVIKTSAADFDESM